MVVSRRTDSKLALSARLRVIKFDEKRTLEGKTIGQCKVYILKLVFMVSMFVSAMF